MVDNYIMLDGRKFEIDEKNLMLLRAVVGEEKKEKENPFTRENGQMYYYISGFGSVAFSSECRTNTDDNRYEVGNYSTDEKLMEQRALHETLNRLLWRFSKVQGDDEYDKTWNNSYKHWYIYIDKKYQEVKISWSTRVKCFNTIYFSSYELASEAIAKVVIPFMTQNPNFNLFEDPEKR